MFVRCNSDRKLHGKWPASLYNWEPLIAPIRTIYLTTHSSAQMYIYTPYNQSSQSPSITTNSKPPSVSNKQIWIDPLIQTRFWLTKEIDWLCLYYFAVRGLTIVILIKQVGLVATSTSEFSLWYGRRGGVGHTRKTSGAYPPNIMGWVLRNY